MTSLTLATPDSPMSAADFVKSLAGVDRHKREDAALAALLAGHVPSYMREFVDVTVTFADAQGAGHKLVIRALPDYLCIGTDADRLRIPLWPLTAQRVADAWNCVLPTSKLVTILWNAAPSKLPPQPWGPPYDASMMSTERIVAHNARVEATIKKLAVDATKLMGGHKKDVVLTKQLAAKPKSVAIFGWHQANGKPIQPVYLGHENTYADYSHGIRMVSRECLLDDQPDDLGRVLMDANLCGVVSSEGPLPFIRQPGV
jgi:hypothetical protein